MLLPTLVYFFNYSVVYLASTQVTHWLRNLQRVLIIGGNQEGHFFKWQKFTKSEKETMLMLVLSTLIG